MITNSIQMSYNFNKLLLLILFCSLTSHIFGQFDNSHYKLTRVDLKNTSIEAIARLGLEADHGFYAPGRFWMNYLNEEETNLLKEHHIDYTHVETDFLKTLERNNYSCEKTIDQITDPKRFRLGTMAGYYTYEDMNAILDTMRMLYPHLISQRFDIDTFKTFEGRPIQWLRISNNPDQTQSKPRVLYTALHHAREPMSLSQLIYYIWYLLEHYDSDAEIKNLIDNTELYFIPCINPDGYVYNATNKPEGGGMWRKNRKLDQSGFYGVDLNRNYGWKWGFDDTGSSPDPLSQVYRGRTPFSEPETQAVAALTDQFKFSLALNNHTFGNYVIYPWNYTSEPCPDDAVFKSIASTYAGQNSFAIGNTMQTVGYLSNGGSDDWIYAHDPEHKTFSLTPEIGLTSEGFWPAAANIRHLCKTTLKGNIVFAEMAHRYFEVEFLDPLYLLKGKSNPFQISVNRIGVEQGPVTVKFKVVSDNAIINHSSFDLNLNFPESTLKELIITPNILTANNDLVLLEITKIMNNLTLIDTIQFTIKSDITFTTNTCDDLLDFILDGIDWGIDFSEYHSAPSSIGDSPNQKYHENQNSGVVLEEPFQIPVEEKTLLTYWLKWDIEGNFDYAQVYAITDDGEFPLCGKFTRPGTVFQKEGQPIYDGNSIVWLKEEVDMTQFAGQEIFIGIRLVSDDLENRNGINIDDIELITYQDHNNSSKNISPQFTKIYPNPTEGELHIAIDAEKTTIGDLIIKDCLGRKVKELTECDLSNLILDVGAYHSGLYFIEITLPNQLKMVKKWIKL